MEFPFSNVGYDPASKLYVLKDKGAKYYIDFDMLQVYKAYTHAANSISPNSWYNDISKADKKKVKKVEQ